MDMPSVPDMENRYFVTIWKVRKTFARESAVRRVEVESALLGRLG
jgi:hypothetical protein